VLIEQRDFAEILSRYDSPDTWFYLDPPCVHFQANGRYDALSETRREELFELLAGLKGSFLMSFDDCPEVREIARRHRFRVRGVEVTYTLSRSQTSRANKVGEVLVSPK
jgi:DNA adenine methylase